MDAVDVVGLGGIGCAIGYAMRASGRSVRGIDADPAKLDWCRRHGLAIDRRPPVPIEVVAFADWQPSPDRLVILCTKTYDNPAVLAKLPPGVDLLPIQNGFDAALEARDHALEGIASFVSECLPGRTHTRITRRGAWHLGPYRGRPDDVRIHSAAGAVRLTRRARVVTVPAILPFKYAKLMYNAAISPLASAAGIDNGDLLGLPAARRLFFALMLENHAVLTAAGVPLGKVGPFHPDTVAKILRRPWLA